MSGPEHLPPDDHELEEFLAGRGPHRARYRVASQEQAPAALDAAVLSGARAAIPVAAAPAARVQRNHSRWRLPLSLAATLVLGVGLSTRVLRETPVRPIAQAPDGGVRSEVEMEAYAPAPAPSVGAPVVVAAEAEAVVADSAAPVAVAKARIAENRAQATAEHERMDREFGKAEQQMRQTMAAPAPEALVAAPPPPPPRPAMPGPAMAMPPPGGAPHATVPSAAGIAMSDSAEPASPPLAAMAAPAPRAEAHAKRRAAMRAFPAEPFLGLTGRYRAESGIGLELSPDGRFALSSPGTPSAAVTLHGRRQSEAGGERLVPDAGTELPCALWLQSPYPAGSSDSVQLRSECESGYSGVYRREESEP